MTDLVGQTIGHYQILERLGRGGMAEVYRAYHPGLDVYRAVKVIRPELVSEAGFRERFQQEARAVAAMRHPNIVQVHDFGVQGDLYYMVMEYVEGQDLKHLIAERAPIRPLADIVPLVEQIASALTYAHERGIIHRDVKPANVMITAGGQAILMDFGIARMVKAPERITQTGMGLGTPVYMAPEQARAEPDVGPAADVYSLGVILYEMLTGHVPFDADTPLAVLLKVLNDPLPPPRQRNPDVPVPVESAVLKATARDPSQRYPSASLLAQALRQGLADAPARSSPPVVPGARWVVPGLILGLAGLVVLVLTISGVAGGLYVLSRSRSNTTVEFGRLAVAGPIAPETTATLKFDGQAGQTVFFDFQQFTASSELTLLAPDGFTEVAHYFAFDPDSADSGPWALDQAGTYTLSVVPRGDPLEYAVTLRLLDPAVIAGGGLTFGQSVRGSTAAPGQVVSYEFASLSDQTVFFDFQEFTTNADLKLTAPDRFTLALDTYAFDPDSADGDPIRLDQAGLYTFTFDPRGDDLLAFTFIPHRLDPAVVDGGRLTYGQTTRGSLTTPGQAATYLFEAAEGQTTFFDFQEFTAQADVSMMAPDGFTEVFNQFTFTPDTGDVGPFTLDQTGAYRLTIDPRGDDTLGFAFIPHLLDPAVIEGGPLTPGTPVRGAASQPGQSVTYTLEASAGQTISFDYQTFTAYADLSLLAPDGFTEVFEQFAFTPDTADSDPIALDQTGTYTLTLDPRGDDTLEFAFVLRSPP